MWGLVLLIGLAEVTGAGEGAVSVADMRRNYTQRVLKGKRHRMTLGSSAIEVKKAMAPPSFVQVLELISKVDTGRAGRDFDLRRGVE